MLLLLGRAGPSRGLPLGWPLRATAGSSLQPAAPRLTSHLGPDTRTSAAVLYRDRTTSAGRNLRRSTSERHPRSGGADLNPTAECGLDGSCGPAWMGFHRCVPPPCRGSVVRWHRQAIPFHSLDPAIDLLEWGVSGSALLVARPWPFADGLPGCIGLLRHRSFVEPLPPRCCSSLARELIKPSLDAHQEIWHQQCMPTTGH